MPLPMLSPLAAPLETGLSPRELIGIPIAIVGAVVMSFSALLQHRGVAKVDAHYGISSAEGFGARAFISLLRNPTWLVGTVLIGVAIALQFGALLFAPLVVIQPLGVVSLIVTTLISARQSRTGLRRSRVVAVILSVVGVAGFVVVASTVAIESPVTTDETILVIVISTAAVLLSLAVFGLIRKTRHRGLFYIIAGGMLYGFTASVAKVILARLREGDFDWLSILATVVLVVTVGVGSYFVQTAHASGSADMVIAGLTVIDPIVAVTIGIVVLGEMAGGTMLTFVLFLVFGAISIGGVLLMHSSQTPLEAGVAKQVGIARSSRIRPGSR